MEKIGHKDVRTDGILSASQRVFNGLKIQPGNGYLVVDADEFQFLDFLDFFFQKIDHF